MKRLVLYLVFINYACKNITQQQKKITKELAAHQTVTLLILPKIILYLQRKNNQKI